jgi:hypothetical protein
MTRLAGMSEAASEAIFQVRIMLPGDCCVSSFFNTEPDSAQHQIKPFKSIC